MSKIPVLLFIALFCSCMTPEKMQNRAVEKHQDFIRKYSESFHLKEEILAPEALYTVVLIQQKHYSDIFTDRVHEELEKATEKDKIREIQKGYFSQIQEIELVQRQIYEFLMKVSSEKDFLFVEGRSYPHRYRDIFLKEFTANTLKKVNSNINYKSSNIGSLSEPYFFMGATIPIHKKRRMHVVGAENLALLNLTLSLYNNPKLSASDLTKLAAECHEAREDVMLENLTKNFDDLPHLMNSIRFLICGSKHDFKNNVEEWNKKNPDRKMNLIVFTPEKLL